MAFPDPDNQFKEGESGNPKGRPKGSRNRSTVAREMLQAALKFPSNAKNKSIIEQLGLSTEGDAEELMTAVQIAKAIMSGDTKAYQAVLDSAHGAPKQQVEHDMLQPITKVEIIHTDASKPGTE